MTVDGGDGPLHPDARKQAELRYLYEKARAQKEERVAAILEIKRPELEEMISSKMDGNAVKEIAAELLAGRIADGSKFVDNFDPESAVKNMDRDHIQRSITEARELLDKQRSEQHKSDFVAEIAATPPVVQQQQSNILPQEFPDRQHSFKPYGNYDLLKDMQAQAQAQAQGEGEGRKDETPQRDDGLLKDFVTPETKKEAEEDRAQESIQQQWKQASGITRR